MTHVLVGPEDCQPGCCQPGCWKCERTLALCKVCGQAERQLQRVCPGPHRPMPTDPSERQIALTIIEWAAEDSEARELDPKGVSDLRVIMADVLRTDREWRWAYDAALRIWQKGYARQEEIRGLF